MALWATIQKVNVACLYHFTIDEKLILKFSNFPHYTM